MAERLAALDGLDVDLDKVQTNMVYVGTRGTGRKAAELVPLLADEGLWALDEGVWTLRFVAHLGLDDADVEEAARDRRTRGRPPGLKLRFPVTRSAVTRA